MSFIDLHCHTIATKIGEGKGRNVDLKTFALKIHEAKIQILGITNHNYFDKEQYFNFKKNNQDILILPGIEINVTQTNGDPGHCIIISNDNSPSFDHFIKFISDNKLDDLTNAENFNLKTNELVDKIKNLDCLVIIHYAGKSPSFNETDYNLLKQSLSEKNQLFVEPSNMISAFIYMNGGYKCMVGSDVRNWRNYPGKELPELKISINSFDKFKLLLKKDNEIIKEFLEDKRSGLPIHISSTEFKDLNFKIQFYKDINVIFGGKSCGKSLILRAIKDELTNLGRANQTIFYDHSKVNEEFDNLKEYLPSKEDLLKKFPVLDEDDFNTILSYKPFIPTNVLPDLKLFIQRKKSKLETRLSISQAINNFGEIEDSNINQLKNLNHKLNEINCEKLEAISKEFLPLDKHNTFVSLLKEIISSINEQKKQLYIQYKSIYLAKNTIIDFRQILANKKAQKQKPISIGLFNFYLNYKRFISSCRSIGKYLKTYNFTESLNLGYLDGKGHIERITYLSCDPKLLNKEYSRYNKSKRITIKQLKHLYEEFKHFKGKDIWNDKLDASISSMISSIKDAGVTSLEDFVYIKNVFVKENKKEFIPSSGDQSTLILNQYLYSKNSEIQYYLFDEPEMSVGHNYVANYIIPRLKELGKEGKTVIVVTHDANIGVCTLPYQTIYRKEADDKYLTYIGNPFTGKLIEISNKDELDWSETALSYLEGGSDVFTEREVTYGRN